MDIANPLELLKNFPISEIKVLLVSLKKDLEDLQNEPDYDGQADILLIVIANLEKELANTDDINSLSIEKQARVLADMNLLMQFLYASQDGQDDFDEYDEEEEDEDDEEEEDENEDEDEEEEKK